MGIRIEERKWICSEKEGLKGWQGKRGQGSHDMQAEVVRLQNSEEPELVQQGRSKGTETQQ